VQAILDKFDDAYVASWSIMSILKRPEADGLSDAFKAFKEVWPESTKGSCESHAREMRRVLRGVSEGTRREAELATAGRGMNEGSEWRSNSPGEDMCRTATGAPGKKLSQLMRRMTVVGSPPTIKGEAGARAQLNPQPVRVPTDKSDMSAVSYLGRGRGISDAMSSEASDVMEFDQQNPRRLRRQHMQYLQGAISSVSDDRIRATTTAHRSPATRAVIRSLYAEAFSLLLTIRQINVMIKEHAQWSAREWRGRQESDGSSSEGSEFDEDDGVTPTDRDYALGSTLLNGENGKDDSDIEAQ